MIDAYYCTEGVDYFITPDPDHFNDDLLSMSTNPVMVNITLVSDAIQGEGSEEIVLTLVQHSPIEGFRVLISPTVRITVQDKDCKLSRLASTGALTVKPFISWFFLCISNHP